MNLNQELVKQGWCWWYRKYAPGDTVLEGLENEAREAGKGCGLIRSRCRRGSGGRGERAMSRQDIIASGVAALAGAGMEHEGVFTERVPQTTHPAPSW